MALATQCPHCFTTFRVAADQLKLRGGIVRCGACQSVFDGNAHLIDLDKLAAEKAASEAAAAAAAGSPPPVETAAAAPAAPETPEALAVPDAPPAPAPDDDALPVYTLDFDRTFDPLGILPKATSPDENTVPITDVPVADMPVADVPVADVPVADVPVEPTPEPTARAHVWRTGAARPAEPAADAAPPAAAPEPDAEPEPAPAAPEPAVPAPAADAAGDAPPAVDTPPVSVPAAPPPAPAFRPAPVPASAYAPQGRIEPSFDLPPDEELVAQPLPDFEPEPAFDPAPRIEPPTEVPTEAPTEPLAGPFTEPVRAPAPQPAPAPSATPDPGSFPAALPLRASAGVDVNAAPAPSLPAKSARGKAVEARTRRSKLTPTKIDAPKLRVPVDADADEPEFVKRSRRQERSSRTRRILMGVGAAVLLLALAAQLVLNFRNGLAARYPGAKPVLGAACAVLGCRVDLPADVDNLAIETGELNPLGADTYVLNTLLRNGGSLVQAWPSIELELIDDDNKPVLRRVLAPAEYLPRGTPAAAGFGAHSEQPVKLHFALAGLKPSGYHTFVFYP